MNKEIVIRIDNSVLVLYHRELLQLLSSNPIMYQNAVRRGKILRQNEEAASRAIGERTDNPWSDNDYE